MSIRRTFEEIVQSADVDISLEYLTLWKLFNRSFEDKQGLDVGYISNDTYRRAAKSFYGLIDDNFMRLPVQLRKTARSLEVFNCANGFSFLGDDYEGIDLNRLLTYIEYVMSLIATALEAGFLQQYDFAVSPFVDHCKLLTERIGHKIVLKGGIVNLVPMSMPVIEVARLLPEDLSYKTYMYHHRSVTGDLVKKKETLYALAQQLEPRRRELSPDLERVVFGLVNNAHVRHNNLDESDHKKFQPKIAALTKEELENLYDDIYEMMLLAFMSLDAKSIIKERTDFLRNLKNVDG